MRFSSLEDRDTLGLFNDLYGTTNEESTKVFDAHILLPTEEAKMYEVSTAIFTPPDMHRSKSDTVPLCRKAPISIPESARTTIKVPEELESTEACEFIDFNRCTATTLYSKFLLGVEKHGHKSYNNIAQYAWDHLKSLEKYKCNSDPRVAMDSLGTRSDNITAITDPRHTAMLLTRNLQSRLRDTTGTNYLLLIDLHERLQLAARAILENSNDPNPILSALRSQYAGSSPYSHKQPFNTVTSLPPGTRLRTFVQSLVPPRLLGRSAILSNETEDDDGFGTGEVEITSARLNTRWPTWGSNVQLRSMHEHLGWDWLFTLVGAGMSSRCKRSMLRWRGRDFRSRTFDSQSKGRSGVEAIPPWSLSGVV